jgi:hypothetical protein
VKSLHPHKNGDTFDIEYLLPIVFGSLLSTIASQIRDEDHNIIETLTVTPLTPDATYTRWQLTADASETLSWPIKTLYCDIKHISIDNKIIRSETFAVPVERFITA